VSAVSRAWSADRPTTLSLEHFPTLAAVYEHSRERIVALRHCLADLARTEPRVLAVAVSGSLGRLEALPHSDADLIVILADDVPPGPSRDEAMEAVWKALQPLGLPRPKTSGIFARPTTPSELTDPSTIGKVADDVAIFGKRMQMLLDVQPLYGQETYAILLDAVLRRSASGSPDDAGDWRYLRNDLMRYYRSLCVQEQWTFGERGGGWFVRDVKTRHSRVLLYAGLLFLLGESGKETVDRVGWLSAHLRLTPLERIATVYAANNDPHFANVAAPYERFLTMMGNPNVRAALSLAPPTGSDDCRQVPQVYEDLRANAESLASELIRFMLARRDEWSEQFFRGLFF
jgi:hypothetical protein